MSFGEAPFIEPMLETTHTAVAGGEALQVVSDASTGRNSSSSTQNASCGDNIEPNHQYVVHHSSFNPSARSWVPPSMKQVSDVLRSSFSKAARRLSFPPLVCPR